MNNYSENNNEKEEKYNSNENNSDNYNSNGNKKNNGMNNDRNDEKYSNNVKNNNKRNKSNNNQQGVSKRQVTTSKQMKRVPPQSTLDPAEDYTEMTMADTQYGVHAVTEVSLWIEPYSKNAKKSIR